jgi:hypothetical protein
MPQITVTLADDVYWDLQNLPKGLKSKFVNQAMEAAILRCIDNVGTVCPARMHAYARGRLGAYDAAIHKGQTKLGLSYEEASKLSPNALAMSLSLKEEEEE